MKINLYRIKFGLQQLLIHPALNIIWIVLFVGGFWSIRQVDNIIHLINAPNIISPFFKKMLILGITLVISAVILGILYGTAELVAKDLEAKMALAFDKKHLKGGNPIVTYKRKLEKIYIVEVYSLIPLNVWTEHKGTLADLMNCKFLTEFECSDKSNRIIMKYIKRQNSKKITFVMTRISNHEQLYSIRF